MESEDGHLGLNFKEEKGKKVCVEAITEYL